MRAANLMSHLHEPEETFLGVSSGKPKGRGVGAGQAQQLIKAIQKSKAFKSGLLNDLSEVALYVEGIDRDKISDLTTNIIRSQLVTYTHEQCQLFNVPMKPYSGPPFWDISNSNWIAKIVDLPHIDNDPVLLVPKYIVRRKLSLDSQEFYNKQITDFLVAENLKANSSLVQVIKGKRKVAKGDVRKAKPKSKPMITDMVAANPELLEMYKEIAKKHTAMQTFNDEDPTVTTICGRLASVFDSISSGSKDAEAYHQLVLGSLTALFYPDLIQPHKEWEIHGGRKRIDIVYTNAANTGFFSHRRNDKNINANAVIVECKNYSDDIANNEIDQLLSRFDMNRGKFGFMTCRSIDNQKLLKNRCIDAASRGQGYIIVFTDDDFIKMLKAKSQMDDAFIEDFLHRKFRELIT